MASNILEVEIGRNELGEIESSQVKLGDYADIDFGHGGVFRYYIIKINPEIIEIAQIDNPNQIRYLVKIHDIWRATVSGSTEIISDPHTVTFIENAIDIRYFERDFIKAPSKIITIAQKTAMTSIELKNGIILYRPNDKDLSFADYTRSDFLAKANRAFDATSFDLAKAFTFLDSPILDGKSSYSVFDCDDEIIIIDYNSKAIFKLNLENLSLEEYDKDPKIHTYFFLNNKKLLSFLDDTVYILDLTTKQRIPIDNTSIIGTIGDPIVYELFNGDIIFRDYEHLKNIYRIDIKTAIITKITKFKQSIEFISELQDDTMLAYNIDLGMIQIWNPITNQFIDIWPLKYDEDADIYPENNPIVSVLLINGDVLFFFDKQYYLFNYITRQLVKLHLMNNNYTRGIHFIGSIKQLKNGNLLITNDKHLSVIEFPLSQREMDRLNYDKMNSKVLSPDMLALIRKNL